MIRGIVRIQIMIGVIPIVKTVGTQSIQSIPPLGFVLDVIKTCKIIIAERSCDVSARVFQVYILELHKISKDFDVF